MYTSLVDVPSATVDITISKPEHVSRHGRLPDVKPIVITCNSACGNLWGRCRMCCASVHS
jgi:hypothetical protein